MLGYINNRIYWVHILDIYICNIRKDKKEDTRQTTLDEILYVAMDFCVFYPSFYVFKLLFRAKYMFLINVM